MCGRFGSFVPKEELARHFEVDVPEAVSPRYNIAPSQPVAIVRIGGNGHRELTFANWGLIPGWAKNPNTGARLINARSETIAEKPAFRAAVKRRRALVPADGFYEWAKGSGTKTPWWFRLNDGNTFAFAGIWERWEGPEGSVIVSMAIITTRANDLVREVHDRMPVILSPDDYGRWLDHRDEDVGKITSLLAPFPAGGMESWPVGPYVNKPGHEGERCIEPAGGGQGSLF